MSRKKKNGSRAERVERHKAWQQGRDAHNSQPTLQVPFVAVPYSAIRHGKVGVGNTIHISHGTLGEVPRGQDVIAGIGSDGDRVYYRAELERFNTGLTLSLGPEVAGYRENGSA